MSELSAYRLPPTATPAAQPRVFVFINGILARPGAHDGWTDRAVTWTQCRTPHKAEKWEYATGALTRRLRQQSRARKIATMLRYYEAAGYALVLVGHSNGCDLIARVLRLRGTEPWYFQHPIEAAHLYAPAAEEKDFAAALACGGLGWLHLNVGGKDRALWWGGVTRRLFGWAGLGYGTLGRQPECPLTYDPRVTVRHEPAYGHSDFFTKGAAFEYTMQHLHAQGVEPAVSDKL